MATETRDVPPVFAPELDENGNISGKVPAAIDCCHEKMLPEVTTKRRTSLSALPPVFEESEDHSSPEQSRGDDIPVREIMLDENSNQIIVLDQKEIKSVPQVPPSGDRSETETKKAVDDEGIPQELIEKEIAHQIIEVILDSVTEQQKRDADDLSEISDSPLEASRVLDHKPNTVEKSKRSTKPSGSHSRNVKIQSEDVKKTEEKQQNGNSSSRNSKRRNKQKTTRDHSPRFNDRRPGYEYHREPPRYENRMYRYEDYRKPGVPRQSPRSNERMYRWDDYREPPVTRRRFRPQPLIPATDRYDETLAAIESRGNIVWVQVRLMPSAAAKLGEVGTYSLRFTVPVSCPLAILKRIAVSKFYLTRMLNLAKYASDGESDFYQEGGMFYLEDGRRRLPVVEPVDGAMFFLRSTSSLVFISELETLADLALAYPQLSRPVMHFLLR